MDFKLNLFDESESYLIVDSDPVFKNMSYTAFLSKVTECISQSLDHMEFIKICGSWYMSLCGCDRIVYSKNEDDLALILVNRKALSSEKIVKSSLSRPVIKEPILRGRNAMKEIEGRLTVEFYKKHSFSSDEVNTIECLTAFISMFSFRNRLKIERDFNKGERQLDELELGIYRVLNGSNRWIVDFDEQGKVSKVSWPDEMRHKLGYFTREEFPDEITALYQRIYPFDLQNLTDKIGKALRDATGKTEYVTEFRICGKDGLLRWLWSSAKFIRDDNGRVRKAIGIVYDITDTKDNEKNREITEALASEYASVYRVDLDGDSIEPVKENKKYKPDNIDRTGKGLFRDQMDRFLNTLTDESKRVWQELSDIQVLREKLADEDRKAFNIQRNDGQWLRVIFYVMERSGADARTILIGFAPMDKDMAERQELEHKLSIATQEARDANKAKTQFLFNMSHDIRTPMNAIKGFTRMARKNIENREKLIEHLNKIDISGNQLLSLINQVLDMSQIESGNAKLELTPADLLIKVENAGTIYKPQAQMKGITFVVEASTIIHRNVLMDVSRVDRLVTNLIGNALKYTPEGGCVTYRVTESTSDRHGESMYTFEVADNGIGMSKEYLDHIYEAFSREHNTTVSNIEGTGLGMSIVRSIVDLLGAEIDIQSEKGKGTTVRITMRLKWNPEKITMPGAAAPLMDISLDGMKILLVEDNELNREIACDILQEHGILVTCAEDGKDAVEAMEKAKLGTYDVVLMDIQMPIMDGYEATRRIRQLDDSSVSRIPIFAMTANAFAEDKESALAAGMNGHLTKPISIDKLLSTLQDVKSSL